MRNHRVKSSLIGAFCFCAIVAFLLLNYRVKVLKVDKEITDMPMKPVCIGRFIVDVPQHALITYRPAAVSGWEISTIQESDDDFRVRLRKKEDLLSTSRNERGGISLEVLRVINDKSDEVRGKIFLFDRKWTGIMRNGKEVISEAVAIDALVRIKEVSYEFKADLRDPARIDDLEKILHQLQTVPEATIPEGAGFCFDHGFIRDPLTAEENEYASFFFGVKEHPDLAISLSSFAGLDPTRTLLQRDAASTIQKEHASRFHRLRSGARSLGGVPGEEVLESVDELNGSKMHGFMWESIGNKNDVYLPSLSLEFSTGLGRPGEPVGSSLSDAEAMALWEKISSSLRRRPIGDSRSQM